jgi:hypothetical protein
LGARRSTASRSGRFRKAEVLGANALRQSPRQAESPPRELSISNRAGSAVMRRRVERHHEVPYGYLGRFTRSGCPALS